MSRITYVSIVVWIAFNIVSTVITVYALSKIFKIFKLLKTTAGNLKMNKRTMIAHTVLISLNCFVIILYMIPYQALPPGAW